MGEEGGFYIEFSKCEDLERALSVVEEKTMYLMGWEPELDGNTIGVYDDCEIEYDDFEGIFEKICKAIAKAESESAFTGVASYQDTDTKEQAVDRISYEGHKMVVENLFASHEAMCPECGSKEIFLEEYYPDKPVRCEDCGFKMPAADVYGTLPEYEKHVVEM